LQGKARKIAIEHKESCPFKNLTVAILVRGGHIVEYAINERRKMGYESIFQNSLHAERALIAKATKKGLNLDDSHYKLLVYRFNIGEETTWELFPSTPCFFCANRLKETSLRVVFLTENNKVEQIKFNKVKSVKSLAPDEDLNGRFRYMYALVV